MLGVAAAAGARALVPQGALEHRAAGGDGVQAVGPSLAGRWLCQHQGLHGDPAVRLTLLAGCKSFVPEQISVMLSCTKQCCCFRAARLQQEVLPSPLPPAFWCMARCVA